MNKQNQPLFPYADLGLGFHNVGTGLLRGSSKEIIQKVEKHYGQRCGHIPTNAETIGVIVEYPTRDVYSQMEYLSDLMGKKINVMSSTEVKNFTNNKRKTLIVPYITVPESLAHIEQNLQALSWGLPGKMTHVLKNKTEFNRLIDQIRLDGFQNPEYIITELKTVVSDTKQFLQHIEVLYDDAGVKNHYPLGVMLRASDEDGNYGCALIHEKDGQIIAVPDGDTSYARFYNNWDEALIFSQTVLAAAMDTKKESRVVVSRYIEIIDSPGMSLVILEGDVFSLGWNGQLQLPGSKACVGTSSYSPKNDYLKRLQQEHEDYTSDLFETFLRKTAEYCGIDFSSVSGLANIDIMIPSEIEKEFQKKTGKKNLFYFSECNPRITNYTDAIFAIINVKRGEQTVKTMKSIIAEGIATIDKYKLHNGLDPKIVREQIYKQDQKLKAEGTRIICRMATNPIGLIYAGDLKHAENSMSNIVAKFSEK